MEPTFEQHMATLDEQVADAAADSGLSEDEIYADMVWNYVVSNFPSEDHPMAKEMRRCTGTQRRDR